jgi:rSAM/selenodomain-associated transferase 1
MNRDCTILIFAKAPVPGFAKTRLARRIGEESAAALAARMLDHTVATAVAADVGPVQLCCAPDTAHTAFEKAMRNHGVSLVEQGEGDLGVRLHRAFCRALPFYRSVIIIGTDAPGLVASHLSQSAAVLQQKPAVFVPATDGGYALVGLSEPVPALFEDMTWSTSSVMAHTRERLLRSGLEWMELAQVHDVDEAEDLIHLPKEWLE